MERSALKNNGGFTLIEVLIAVAIVAIALLAITRTLSVTVKDSSYVRDKTAAHWVALDIAAKVQVGLIPITLYSGNQSGSEKMWQETYQWKINLNVLPVLPVIQVTIQIFNSQQKLLDTLELFMPTPKSR